MARSAIWLLLLATLLVLTGTAAASPGLRRLERVELMDGTGDDQWLAITTDRPANFTSFKLSHPSRIVVDFPETLAKPGWQATTKSGHVARWGIESLGNEESPVARLTVELHDDADYTLTSEGSLVNLLLVPARARPLLALEGHEDEAPGTTVAIAEAKVPAPELVRAEETAAIERARAADLLRFQTEANARARERAASEAARVEEKARIDREQLAAKELARANAAEARRVEREQVAATLAARQAQAAAVQAQAAAVQAQAAQAARLQAEQAIAKEAARLAQAAAARTRAAEEERIARAQAASTKAARLAEAARIASEKKLAVAQAKEAKVAAEKKKQVEQARLERALFAARMAARKVKSAATLALAEEKERAAREAGQARQAKLAASLARAEEEARLERAAVVARQRAAREAGEARQAKLAASRARAEEEARLERAAVVARETSLKAQRAQARARAAQAAAEEARTAKAAHAAREEEASRAAEARARDREARRVARQPVAVAPLEPAARLAPPTSAPPLASLTQLSFRRTDEGARLTLRTSSPVEFALDSSDPLRVALLLEGTHIPSVNNRRPLDTRFFATAVTRVVPAEERRGRRVRIEIELARAVPHFAHVEDGAIVLDFEGAPNDGVYRFSFDDSGAR